MRQFRPTSEQSSVQSRTSCLKKQMSNVACCTSGNIFTLHGHYGLEQPQTATQRTRIEPTQLSFAFALGAPVHVRPKYSSARIRCTTNPMLERLVFADPQQARILTCHARIQP